MFSTFRHASSPVGRFPRRARSLTLALAAATIATFFASASAAETKTKFAIEEATIADIQAAILAKKITATEVVKLYLARIKAYNGPAAEEPDLLGPMKPVADAKGINALITLNLRPAARKAWGFDDRKARSMTDALDADPKMPDALETAAALDAEFAKTGKLSGPLHGVVMAIKDQYDTFDLRTTSGADADYANDRPPDDSTFVARLRAAGAIILAKANMGEYAAGYRSSFGGTEGNPYATDRQPGGSSGGSATSVAANLVTAAIAEETGPSVRAPARMNSVVGIAPTQELVSRDGMMNIGLNTRVGPIARTVEDAARILSVIAGYDPKDEMTAFAAGRLPGQPYEAFTRERSLKGMRIGVVREYMDKALFTKADEQSIDLVDRAIEDLKKLGATIVEPGPEGLFTPYIRRYNPMLSNASWTKLFPELFPVDETGKPTADHIATLIDLAMDPTKVPGKVTIRDFPQASAPGESKYGFNLYLAQRGDAHIKSLDDLITKSRFFSDPAIGMNKKSTLENNNRPLAYDTAVRQQRRFAIQQIVLACFADLQLDAVVYPTGNIPLGKLGQPNEPTVNGRSTTWTFLGQQGFPTITVPAGFTSEVWDRIRDPNAPPAPARPPGSGRRGGGDGAEGEGGGAGANQPPTLLVGPVPVRMPVGVDFLGRPFSEPTILKIAAAYEAATHRREPPPRFGPLAPSPAVAGSQ
jgi:Asp-tRNA(Asn)/Glu-tRNA(Gln) amidotransferase A subunit family amidase